jgi:serine/threonine protein phosphatase PrpC
VISRAMPSQRAGARSDPGQRPRNEDSFTLDDVSRAPGRLATLAVADGMGGYADGATASAIAVDAVRRANYDSSSDGLRKLVRDVNRQVVAHGTEIGQRVGTTLTIAIVEPHVARVAHVGDSRAYLVHEGRSIQITDDHSVVGELVREGRLTAAEARSHAERNVLQRAIGIESDVDVDVYEAGMGAGDALVLCTDGLHTMVTEDEIAAAVTSNLSMRDAADTLVRLAVTRGGDDNITAVIWRYVDDAVPASSTIVVGRRSVRHRRTGRLIAARIAVIAGSAASGFILGRGFRSLW